jgi:hypothetical protein
LENPAPAPDPARSCPKTPAPVTGFKFQNRPGSGSGQNFISGGTLVLTHFCCCLMSAVICPLIGHQSSAAPFVLFSFSVFGKFGFLVLNSVFRK